MEELVYLRETTVTASTALNTRIETAQNIELWILLNFTGSLAAIPFFFIGVSPFHIQYLFSRLSF